MRYLFLFALVLVFNESAGQDLTGDQLLQKAIDYHDPNGSWQSFNGKFSVTMSTPDGKVRVSDITINLPKKYFHLSATRDSITVEQTFTKEECEFKLNGSSKISEEDKKTHRLTCERANMMKNYYTYLYGLPMKLKDPGTIIDSKIQKKTFKGKKYLTLRATYTKEVGEDIWYFYFDPKTYAMEVYQFFHDEVKNDGEYILLTEQEEISGIKMPKTRAWYTNKKDKHLGTDVLTKGSSL